MVQTSRDRPSSAGAVRIIPNVPGSVRQAATRDTLIDAQQSDLLPENIRHKCVLIVIGLVSPAIGVLSDGGNARHLGDAVEPVVLTEREQSLGLGGERADRRARLGLTVEDPVRIPA